VRSPPSFVRNPSAKHQFLEMYVRHGLELPDTPTMALHQGRIDLLEEHLRRGPGLMPPRASRENSTTSTTAPWTPDSVGTRLHRPDKIEAALRATLRKPLLPPLLP
jgi:hypothetical protein